MRRIAIALIALASALGLTAPPAQAAVTPGPYVALGDSFSAASGVLPVALSQNLLCQQSVLNYPHLIAQRTGRSLRDVTCGAATTSDFYRAQYLGMRPQLDALSADTRLVTVGIGGNNEGVFLDAILACGTAAQVTLGFGSPCKNLYGSTFTSKIASSTYPAVKQALLDVRARAPHASVAVVGYPRILPETGGCYPIMPIARGDVGYVNDIERALNGVIQRAAAETGVTYVDMWGPSLGRDACSGFGTRWVEPMLLGTNTIPVHPNAAGEAAIAARTMTTLGL